MKTFQNIRLCGLMETQLDREKKKQSFEIFTKAFEGHYTLIRECTACFRSFVFLKSFRLSFQSNETLIRPINYLDTFFSNTTHSKVPVMYIKKLRFSNFSR